MGQKVHPVGYRLGGASDWQSKWYAGRKEYAAKLHEDLRLHDWIMKKWEGAAISRVEIERVGHVIRFTIWTARPGVVIGKGGTEIQTIKGVKSVSVDWESGRMVIESDEKIPFRP